MTQIYNSEDAWRYWLAGYPLYVKYEDENILITSSRELIEVLYLNDYEYLYYLD